MSAMTDAQLLGIQERSGEQRRARRVRGTGGEPGNLETQAREQLDPPIPRRHASRPEAEAARARERLAEEGRGEVSHGSGGGGAGAAGLCGGRRGGGGPPPPPPLLPPLPRPAPP